MADRSERTTDLDDSAALDTSGGVLVPSLSLFLSLNPKTPILNDDEWRIERGRDLVEERKVYSVRRLGERGERGRRRGVREDDDRDEADDEADDEEGGWERARVAIL